MKLQTNLVVGISLVLLMINMHDHHSHHIIHTPGTAPANRPNMVSLCNEIFSSFA